MKIIITGDILRPTEIGTSHQNINIKWFYNLFHWQIQNALPTSNIKCLLWNEGDYQFDTSFFYQLNNMEISVENWAILFDTKTFTSRAEEYLLNFFKKSLVVGFELPPSFISFFDRHNITYIDFYIDPIRFLDDIFFSVSSNDMKINKSLKRYELNEELIYVQAGIHLATISRIQTSLEIHENSCLIVGQTPIDRSLIEDGKVLSITDFSNELEEIKINYSHIYFKLHPYDYNNKELLEYLKRMHLTVVDENIYILLAHENIKKIYAISSSIVHEAKFFNKSAIYLKKIKPNNKYIKIYNNYFSYKFWKSLIDDTNYFDEMNSNSISNEKNRLRNSLGQYWGYPMLSDKILYREIAKDEIRLSQYIKKLDESKFVQFFKPLLKMMLKKDLS